MSFSSIKLRAAMVPLALAAAAFSGTASAAPHAVPTCTPSTAVVKSYGATFQEAAQAAWINAPYCPASAADIIYNNTTGTGGTGTLASKGSGRCVNLVKNHTPDSGVDAYYDYVAYCGSDDPLTLAEWQQANNTGNPTAAHNVINQVPVAVGADAIIYNDGGVCGTTQLDLDVTVLSGIFDGTITNFSQLDPACGSQSITRVVRNAVSGTTCILKSYLAKRGSSNWGTLNSSTGCGSISWPNDSGATATSKQNGNGGIVSTVSATVGTIGYTDLATNVDTSNALKNKVARVQTVIEETPNVPGHQPGELPYDGTATSVGAANCPTAGAVPPHTSSPGWDSVTLSDGPVDYPICGYTYAFIFTNCAAEVNQAGTHIDAQVECDAAVDLLLWATSPLGGQGQSQLATFHYAPLPSNALAVARAGLATIL